MTKQKLQKVR